MYIKTNNGVYEKMYSIGQLRKDNPQTSFPENPKNALLAEWNVYPLTPTEKPNYDPNNEKVVEGIPTNENNTWVQVWDIVPLTNEEKLNILRDIEDDIVSRTQYRLDQFARTRNYDSILSACTYATDPNIKFQIEGQYCVEARSATWIKLYEILAEVLEGKRPVPSGYAEIEPELPELIWPD